MRWHRGAVVAGLGAVCLSLGSCASGSEVVSAGGVTILVGERSDDAADALLAGELADVSGCLGVNDTVVVWPHGTKLALEDPLTLEIPGVGRVRIGEHVNIGGGVALDQHQVPHAVGDFNIAGVTVPARCTDHNVWVGG